LRELRRRSSTPASHVEATVREIDHLRERTIPELAGALLAESRAREFALETRIRSVGKQLGAIPPRSVEEEALERRVRNTQSFYNELQLRHEAALLAEAQSLADLRLLYPAVPPHQPLRRGSPTSLLMLVVVIGLCVAVADALLLDWLDRGLERSYRV
jgi:uncharacterized protein involved in exopolysaccharide biosynthesis